jgi:hypothetical protein
VAPRIFSAWALGILTAYSSRIRTGESSGSNPVTRAEQPTPISTERQGSVMTSTSSFSSECVDGLDRTRSPYHLIDLERSAAKVTY